MSPSATSWCRSKFVQRRVKYRTHDLPLLIMALKNKLMEKALAQLIPGTEDYYYFHALHFQNTGQAAKYGEMLAQWTKRFPNSGQRKVIERRQALLDYDTNPKASLETIRRELGLEFNHQQEGKAQEQKFPTELNQADLSKGS